MKFSREDVVKAQAGDRSALGRLVAQTQDPLFHFLSRELGSAADAEDALQETWKQALHGLPALRDPAAFSGWIHRIAIRAARDLAVAGRVRHRVEGSASRNELIEGEAMNGVLREESAGQVRAAVEALDPDLRTAVRLRYEQGLSYEQIAEATGTPSGTVGKRLHAAHERLRLALAGVGVVLALAVLERELEAAERNVAPESAKRRLSELVQAWSPVSAVSLRRRRGLAAAAVAALLVVLAILVVRAPAGGRGKSRGVGPVVAGAVDSAGPRGAGGPEPAAEAKAPEVKAVVPPDFAAGMGRVTGRVSEAGTGRPIAGARVSLWPVGIRDDKRKTVAGDTDASGNYTVEAEPGGYYIDAWSEEHSPLSVKESVEDIVVRGRTEPESEDEPIENKPLFVGVREKTISARDIELVSGIRLAGRVVDARGFPVEGASVEAFFQQVPARKGFGTAFECAPHGASLNRRTGVDGRFALPAVWPEGTVQLRIECAGYKKKQGSVNLANVRGDLTISIETGYSVAGTVRDTFGRPVTGALVFSGSGDSFVRPLGQATDDLGRFSDPGSTASGAVLAWAPGYGVAAVELEGADTAKLDLRLPAADGKVRGVVRDESGRAVAGARVVVVQLGTVISGRVAWIVFSEDPGFATGDVFGIATKPQAAPECTTGADGSFAFDGIPVATGTRVLLRVLAEGFRREEVRTPGDEEVPVTLHPSPR